MSTDQNPIAFTHALALPSPIHDLRTACGCRPDELPKNSFIATKLDAVTCPQCLIIIGDKKTLTALRDKDWTDGLPTVTLAENPDGSVAFQIAHGMAGVMAQMFLDACTSIGALNYLELEMRGSRTDEEIIVTVQRKQGEPPGQKATRLKGYVDACIPWLNKLMGEWSPDKDSAEAISRLIERIHTGK
jgi:hypothetical protein